MFEPTSGGIGPVADPTQALDASPSQLVFDDEHASIYTMGQVCGMLGVQPAFLRRLDTEEIICPMRSDGHHRRYSRQQIHDIEHLLSLTGEGLTIAGVRRVLLLEAQVRRLEAQIAEMHPAATTQQ